MPVMDLDIRRWFRLLVKRKWYFALGVVGALLLGVLLTVMTTPVYQASSTLFVGQRQITLEELGQGVLVTNLSGRLLKSYAEIIKSRNLAQRAISQSGLSVTPSQIRARLETESLLDTQVIRVTYTDDDPVVAAQVVNAVSRAFVSEIDALSNEVEGTPAVEVSIIDPAVAPTAPIAPNPVRNISLALALGLLAGAGLAFLADHLDQTVKTRDELEKLGLPVLGSVPLLETRDAEVFLERDPQGIGGEAFRKIRTAIGFSGIDHPLKAVLITSSVAQEGKTTLAANLAIAYAQGGFRTLLVEADLRRPSLHRVFGTFGMRGLTTAIVGTVPLDEAVVSTEFRNLSVLLAGAIPPNPVELLGSEQMIDVMRRLRSSFDVLIVDSPPLGPVADPATLAGLCDGVVLVARSGRTDRTKLLDSVQLVERAGGRLIGVAVNFLSPAEAHYDYEYYYGAYRSGTGTEAARAGSVEADA
jgi:receptor protein-tyrosine kinase